MTNRNNGSKERLFLLWIGILFVLLTSPIHAGEDHWEDLGVVRLPNLSPPDFTLPTLDGESITLGELKGKVVLINFWTTWCPPCKEEMPSMERLHKMFKGQPFTILAVDIMEDREKVKSFAETYKLSFPILLDKNGDVSLKYVANVIPTTHIIDRAGKAVGKIVGPRQWDGEDAKAFFDELIGR